METPETVIIYQGQLSAVKEAHSALQAAGVNAAILQPGCFSNT